MTPQEKYEFLKKNNLILFEAVVGSQAYGTALPTSDIDKKFIYIEPLDNLLKGDVTPQLDIHKDYVGYEISRYLELVQKQNPNIQELLYAPEDTVEYVHPAFVNHVMLRRSRLVSNKVRFSYGEYAATQIKKARGQNKKIMQPMDKERKTLLDFCWVGWGQGSVSLKDFLEKYRTENYNPEKVTYIPTWMLGCVAIDHMKNCFHLFLDGSGMNDYWTTDDELLRDIMYARRKYQGIEDKDGVQIKLSSVEKGEKPICTFYCNIEGFSKYCKDYREYWAWVDERNPVRFQDNQNVGAAYDTKNMMHCHRLLDTAIEVLQTGEIQVRRPNREQLLEIRAGKYDYDQLMKDADAKIARIEELYEQNPKNLPDAISNEFVQNILMGIRKEFYKI